MPENSARERSSRLGARVDGVSVKSWLTIALTIAAVVLGFGAWWTYGLDRGEMPMRDGQMTGMAAAEDVPRFPPVAAYYGGEEIFFAHTETSEEAVSDMLTGMMDSPVIAVPGLGRTPEAALGQVYVFTNGVRPEGPQGPLGFQPDVFDSAPGDPGYTPLRRLVQLTWNDDAEPRLLTSLADVDKAIDAGELSAHRSDVVINAPLLTWPDGQR